MLSLRRTITLRRRRSSWTWCIAIGTRVPTPTNAQKEFPGTAALAALRAWYAGLGARAAVAQYLGQDKASGQSSRAMLGDIRRQLGMRASGTGRIWPAFSNTRQASARSMAARSWMQSRRCGICRRLRRW